MDKIITDSEVERRSTAETELDLQTELLGKIKTIERFNTFISQFFIEMDVLHSDENKTLHDVEIDEILKTEQTDEGEETLEYQFRS